ncbi:hypothetical protein JMA_22070 [Jeotgalibacillus malaysiensis]|uniref:Uncharacterized protein n=1 Tax=Jeotgalibacillus malaysiensis TaxID=1508404 RepID=A0A0B5AU34_9BACL|nr:peptidoglycan-binding protein [Jeotgalibacillus malaysiensis]AJD91524.1 hypothetical protein JMA_22070 [Jeotgalibacillus malaysiensis]
MSRVSLQTLIDRSVRNMGAVDSRIRDMAVEIIKRAYKEGINVQISSGLRTHAEQNALYAKGRTAPGNIVTNARAGQSVHNYGLAVDYFLTNHTGTTATWTVNAQWRRVAAIAKSMGFTWGGDWTSFPDAPHLEYTKGLTWRDLQAGKRPSFRNVPAVEKTWLELGDEGAGVKAMQELLNKHGYAVTADGIFGRMTESALRSFQYQNDLTVDGVYGTNTKAVLEEKSTSKPATKPQPKEEEDEMLKQAIVINTFNDYPAAEVLAVRLKAPIYPRAAVKGEVAKELLVVGGNKDGLKADKIIVLAGKGRFDTAEKVQEYVNKL